VTVHSEGVRGRSNDGVAMLEELLGAVEDGICDVRYAMNE
jgi:hypothetical protein